MSTTAAAAAAAAAATSKTFALGSYASIEAVIGDIHHTASVAISKTPYQRDRVSATLDFQEWRKLGDVLPIVRQQADEMHVMVQNDLGDPTNQMESTNIISERYALTVNLFKAPNGVKYITASLRLYFHNTEGVLKLKRENGVTHVA